MQGFTGKPPNLHKLCHRHTASISAFIVKGDKSNPKYGEPLSDLMGLKVLDFDNE